MSGITFQAQCPFCEGSITNEKPKCDCGATEFVVGKQTQKPQLRLVQPSAEDEGKPPEGKAI